MLYRLFTSTAGATNQTSLDFRIDDAIQAVLVSVSAIADSVAAGTLYWELSFVSVEQDGVNDTTSIVASGALDVPAQGGASTVRETRNEYQLIALPDVSVASGERIYLTLKAGACNATAYVHIYTAKGDVRPTTRRR